MPTYELWNNDNTNLIVSATTADALKISKMADKGYMLVVTPIFDPATHKLGVHIFNDTEISWTVVPLTQPELDALDEAETLRVEAIAQRAILDLEKDSQYILALVGQDDAWIGTKIDNSTGGATNAEIVENIRTTLKEIVYTQRDVADILTALYKLGMI